MEKKIEVGAIVRYAPKWRSPGEEKYLHVVMENTLNPCTNQMTRWLIKTINTGMFFAPTEVVEEDMIEPTGFNVEDYLDGKVK